jgi:flagellar biosynthetic protein FlhB
LGFAPQKLAPDFKRLNPLPRLLDLPRQNLTQLGQAAILFPVFAWTVWALAEANLPLFMSLVRMGVGPGLMVISGSVQSLLWKAAALFVILGVVDLFRQKRRYRKDLRMSKQEIREEYKEVEGNPQVKAHIRRLMRSLLRRRMMSEVPKATAVIVNPTHYAVAIRYQMESMAAPRVVAKGKNYLARRIRRIALDNEIPIVENPPLAQSLYKAVEVGQEIPAHLYRAVAEVLAYIYRLMHMRPVVR